ncbi:MAG: TIGR02281 family clan AA aspartic protease [Sphingomicrobium sp.]
MARLYLIIIAVGVFIGAMLPSGSARHLASPATGHSRDIISVDSSSKGGEGAGGSPVAASAMGGPWTTLDRSANGHFFADAQVNGMTVHFLIDTGASGVALTTEDAQRVGLQFSPVEFAAVGTGASGEVRGKLVTLDRVSLGGRSVEGVDGVILEGGGMSLLGQSFLSKMGTIEISGDRMVIR